MQPFAVGTPNGAREDQVWRAVHYLESHYVQSVGLLYESEDAGTHWLKRAEYPGYRWPYNKTFWLYSDNLFAIYALQPFNVSLSSALMSTYRAYNPPPSGKFEAVIGTPVGPSRAPRDVVVKNGENFTVLYRIHDGQQDDPMNLSLDNAVYSALSRYYSGETNEARREILGVASAWNGTALVEPSASQNRTLRPSDAWTDMGYYPNFKVALLIYGAQVTGASLPNLGQLENHLWAMQRADGGITTLSDGKGNPLGSANTETTALAILSYNYALVASLRNRQPAPTLNDPKRAALGIQPPYGLFGLITAAALGIAIVFRWPQRKTRPRTATSSNNRLQPRDVRAPSQRRP